MAVNKGQKGKRVQVRKSSKKKKKWFDIVAPKVFNSLKIGETLAYEPSQLVGRKLRVNLMVLTNDPKKQNTNVNFKVASLSGENGVCKIVGYELNRSYIKRMVRKSTSKIDDSFVVESKSGLKFKIKPLLIARFKINNSVATEIRKKLRENVGNFFKEKSDDEIILAIVQGKLQREIRGSLKKIYPLSAFEIRVLELLE